MQQCPHVLPAVGMFLETNHDESNRRPGHHLVIAGSDPFFHDHDFVTVNSVNNGYSAFFHRLDGPFNNIRSQKPVSCIGIHDDLHEEIDCAVMDYFCHCYSLQLDLNASGL